MAQALDFYLRCNWLKCRAQLTERAVVTTCSHIFCLQCAERLGLSQPIPGERRCPACQAVLHNPDDAVSTVLNPTEDYKTSVLSGLDPNTIVECAGRALMFWTYQTTQEIYYQEYLGKGLTEKYAVLSTHMEKVTNDANSAIANLQNRLSEMQRDQEQLYKKNQELIEMYREKCKKLTQMTNLYNLLKSRAMRSQMQTAVSDSVSHTLNSISGSRNEPMLASSLHKPVQHPLQTPSSRQYNHYATNQDGVEQLHPHQRSGSGSSKGANRRVDTAAMPPPNRPTAGFRNPTHHLLETPQHRTRLPAPSRMFSRDGHHPPASQGNPAGYGLAVGMEVGRPSSGAIPGNPSLQSTIFDSTII